MNAITDVEGVLVGQYQRIGAGWATGTTVVLCPDGSTGSVDGRGGAPGTRETDVLLPENLVSRVDAVCLSGGSAFGLAAADGVMRWLAERDRGFRVGAQPHEVVPIVPAAVLFDLPRGDWGNRPDAEFGYQACAAATAGPVAQGCVGAGTGAKVGSLKGGTGTAGQTVEGYTVGALAAVNALGEAVDPQTGRPWAADLEVAGEFGGRWPDRPAALPAVPRSGLNTTIGVVAVDAALTKTECRRLAVGAQDGLARAVRPAHSMFDGDTVFAVATGARPMPDDPMARVFLLDRLAAAAADVFARAVVHGVLSAEGLAGLPAYRDLWPVPEPGTGVSGP
ncbi:P1 family peptidase [Actinophytocola sp.]|uniref:P1 family peptidase n=1 Tax=Actinophytocola sp. TaxID=1872138 RepID=UPI002D80E94F|nr:P1 family peptidase [Actinophytocola sp.]HET9138100.1 P1 family peptidase [Actinophytocola sp.]